MNSRMVVLGSSGGWPEAGRACSGYDAVIVTHRHLDHMPHFVPNAGVRLSTNSLAVAYSGDTGPDAVLTHLWPDVDRRVSRASAMAAFTGDVLVADEGLVVELP